MVRIPTNFKDAKRQLKRVLVRIKQYIPPGLRWVAGLLIMVGGVFGFLPVLGFWMIPLGVLVILLDVKSLRRWWRNRRRPRP